MNPSRQLARPVASNIGALLLRVRQLFLVDNLERHGQLNRVEATVVRSGLVDGVEGIQLVCRPKRDVTRTGKLISHSVPLSGDEPYILCPLGYFLYVIEGDDIMLL